MNRQQLRNDLMRDEGIRLAAYKDTNSIWTIGVGHALGPSEVTPRVSFINAAEASAWLDMDIDNALSAVLVVFGGIALEDARMRALANMAFNRGQKNMADSTTITPAIKAAIAGTGTWDAVSDAILTSPWGKQIGERATRLAYMFANGKDMA